MLTAMCRNTPREQISVQLRAWQWSAVSCCCVKAVARVVGMIGIVASRIKALSLVHG